jgi:PAS domain S-box-containing protein
MAASATGPADSSTPWTESPEVFAQMVEFAPDAELLVDSDGRIILVNRQATEIFGYSRDELIGQRIEMLIPDRYTGSHVGHRGGYMRSPRVRPMGAGVELFAKRKDGTEIPVDIMLSSLSTSRGTVALAVVRDVTDRKLAEQKIAASLREKETLLREVHHRVKNNLAVIGSMFYLQSSYTQDERTLHLLAECQDRVRSMALVHERLYQSGSLAQVDFAEYTKELCQRASQAYSPAPVNIRLEFELEKVLLNIEQAVPAGLVLNELISNALKHAFPGGRAGDIRVLLSSRDGGFRLSVADSGVGLPDDDTLEGGKSLGLRLIRLLAKQLGAQFAFVRDRPGTEAILELELHHDGSNSH